MTKTVIGKKMEMSQIWIGERVRPLTRIGLIKAGDLSLFSQGDRVKIIGRSKGKGFTGVVKRHHFKGGPATHGQSDRERSPGSVGATTTPGRVLKGKKMAGRSGFSKTTVKTSVLGVNKERQIINVLGSVPGSFGAKVVLEKVL